MGQVIPFRRDTRPSFTDAEIEQMWETYAAAARVEAMVLKSPNATPYDQQCAGIVAEAAQRLFSDAFNIAYPPSEYSA